MHRPGFLIRALRQLVELTPFILLLCAEGMSLALAGWAVAEWGSQLAHIRSNLLAGGARTKLLLTMAAAGSAAVLIAAAKSFASGQFEPDRFRRLAIRWGPLCVVWALPFLFNWRLWGGRELTFLCLLTGAALTFQLLLRRSLDCRLGAGGTAAAGCDRSARPCGAWRRKSKWLPLALILLGCVAYAVYFSKITLDNHYRLGTASMDLGLENNLLWNAVHGGPLFKTSPLGGPTSVHSGYHQTYFAYVIALVYRFWPGSETLLVVQSVLFGFAALPLYLLAKRRVGPWTGVLVAAAYLLYPPLHGPNLWDFHYLPLAIFFLWMLMWCVETRRNWAAAVCVLLTLSLREDVSALLAVLGLFVIAERRRPLAGLALAAAGGLFFVALKLVIMPQLMGGRSAFLDTFEGLLPEGESSFTGVLKTVFSNPVFTLSSFLKEEKLVYFLQIMAPLAFLPWRRPIGLLLSVPGFLFTILSTGYKPLVQISFQYTTYWIVFLFLGIVVNLGWLRAEEQAGRRTRSSRWAWTAAFGLAALIGSHQFGAVLQQNTVRGGFTKYRFGITDADRKRHDQLYELIRQVPPYAKIVSSERIVPHVTNRPDSYTLRTGIFDAEYLLVWLPPSRLERPYFLKALATGKFGLIARRGPFILARRGADPKDNPSVLRLAPPGAGPAR